MADKKCICLFGYKGSGKTYCSKIIKHFTNWELLNTGNYFREQKEKYITIDAFKKFKSSLGHQNVLEIIFEYSFHDFQPEKIIIDSVRELDDLDFLIESNYEVILVYFECEEEERLNRLIQRKRGDDPTESIKMKEFNRWEFNRFNPLFNYKYSVINTNVPRKILIDEINELINTIQTK